MDIHVICCNDSVEYAVIEDLDKANKKLEDLRALHEARIIRDLGTYYKNRDYLLYWHIHTVKGE